MLNYTTTKSGVLSMELTKILKDFYDISGISISIHDIDFNEICSYPSKKNQFCGFIQQYSNVWSDCKKNDYNAFRRVKETGDVYVYKCERGLYEAVAPIYNYGELSGFLMMGQICDETQSSMDYIIEKATKLTGDKRKAVEISATIKKIDKNLIGAYVNIMTVLAEYLTGANRIQTRNKKISNLVAEYINKNYATRITLSILSQKFGYCNTTLTKTFKKEYNLSIMEYLRNVRLEAAKELIVKTQKSFKEISLECGFYDQNYFSKTFTAFYGISPTEFRSSNRNKSTETD